MGRSQQSSTQHSTTKQSMVEKVFRKPLTLKASLENPMLKRIFTQTIVGEDRILENKPLMMHEPRRTMETQINNNLLDKKEGKGSGYNSPVMVWSIDDKNSQDSADPNILNQSKS